MCILLGINLRMTTEFRHTVQSPVFLSKHIGINQNTGKDTRFQDSIRKFIKHVGFPWKIRILKQEKQEEEKWRKKRVQVRDTGMFHCAT